MVLSSPKKINIQLSLLHCLVFLKKSDIVSVALLNQEQLYINKNMKTKLTLSVLLSGLLCVGVHGANVATSIDGAIRIGVFASSAPNAFGSPSWTSYGSSAVNWLQSDGLGSFGDPSTSPTGYAHAAPIIEAGDITVSSFSSWRGVANPSAPFNGELGNRLHFGLFIEAVLTGITFRLSDLSYNITSSDSNVLGFAGDFSTANTFTSTRVGYDGVDYYTSGSAADIDLVGLYYVGVGNGYAASGAGDEQQQIDNVEDYVASQPGGQVMVTGSYTIDYSGSFAGTFGHSTSITVVPEPSVALLGSFGVLAFLRRRRI